MTADIPVIVGDIATALPEDAGYDIVLANLIARILIENVANITRRVAEGGVIVASGIIEPREAEVLAAYEQHGFVTRERRQTKDWIALTLARP